MTQRSSPRSTATATATPQKLCPICRTGHDPAASPCVPHWGARTAGMVDALQGKSFDIQAYPQGRYGHADYAMGYYGVETPQPGCALTVIGRRGER